MPRETIVDAAHVGAIPADRSSASSYARGSGGRFVLRGLTPGRYLIRASVGGPEVRGDTRPPAREEEVGYTSIDVVAADIAGATIQLSKGRRVSGRFVFEGGSPAPPSQLRMAVHAGVTDSMWAMTMPGRPSVAAVSDKLTFELSGLYELPVTMAVTGLPDGWVVKSIRNDGEDITGVPTIFGGGAKPGSLEIVATNRVATPAVRVTDERGDPVSSCHVVLFSVNPSRWRTPLAQDTWAADPRRRGDTWPDAARDISRSGADASRLFRAHGRRLQIRGPRLCGYARQLRRKRCADARAPDDPIACGPRTMTALVLLWLALLQTAGQPPATDGQPATAVIRGRVTDKESGAPIARALVRLGRHDVADQRATGR